eukprot:NODE_777_length_2771_cov_3.552194.p1 GENE.NODE_777_length_2771_cov_3.552194~~NODE_777_length_2771_cov_3.552194.p1  ORF type:complete len:910 (-),score=193.38 NODE_777_length_2771_cov_3.552194:40-2400(-)
MRPVVWSDISGRGWERGGTDVSYTANSKGQRRVGELYTQCHTLAFNYTFEHDNDTVFFAYHYPYTYTYLREFLSRLGRSPYAARVMRRETMCCSLGGMPCDILEICEPLTDGANPRPIAVATARVHPGESNSSWMMQGFLQFLCSPADEARALRTMCTWFIVPMLNPDGVIHGNYRCGLAGADLNRVFMEPHQQLHPIVWHLKQRLLGQHISLYLDLHGHSKKDGIFFYGGHCRGARLGRSANDQNALVQLLPLLCAMGSSDFKFGNSAFAMQRSKLTTARLVAFQKLGILHAYTVEASFSGAAPIEVSNVPGINFNSDRSRSRRHHHMNIRKRRCGNLSAAAVVAADAAFRTSESDLDIEAPAPDISKGQSHLSTDEARNFEPERLELAGPTIGRAVALLWQLDECVDLQCIPARLQNAASGAAKAAAASGNTSGLLCGYEAASWPHLHYERLTHVAARRAYRQLVSLLGAVESRAVQRERRAVAVASDSDEDAGSDSEPNRNDKPAEELTLIHKELLANMASRGEAEGHVVGRGREVPEFRTVVAFGKTLRVAPGQFSMAQPSAPPSRPTSCCSAAPPRGAATPRSRGASVRASFTRPMSAASMHGNGEEAAMPAAAFEVPSMTSMAGAAYDDSDIRHFVDIHAVKAVKGGRHRYESQKQLLPRPDSRFSGDSTESGYLLPPTMVRLLGQRRASSALRRCPRGPSPAPTAPHVEVAGSLSSTASARRCAVNLSLPAEHLVTRNRAHQHAPQALVPPRSDSRSAPARYLHHLGSQQYGGPARRRT